ncbi:MAG: hypothetical protein ABIH68_08630 [bacterium]
MLKLGVDLDGVIADTDAVFRKYIKEITGVSSTRDMITSYFYEECLHISKEDVEKVYSIMQSDSAWKELPVLPDAEKILNELAKSFEIFIITARPVESKAQTEEFLKKHGISVKKIYFISETQRKLDIINGLPFEFSAFIEDRLDFAEEIARAGIDTYLMDYPWNRTDEKIPNLHRVRNWKQIGSALNGKSNKK